jgi:hypothetical protein
MWTIFNISVLSLLKKELFLKGRNNAFNQPRVTHFFAASINSTNEANKAGGTHH